MSFVHEQSDGLIPNKQKPPSTSQLGTSTDKWDEVNATTIAGTTVSGTNVGAGTNMFINGVGLARTAQVSSNLAASGQLLTHGLGVQYPVVQVYDGNGSGLPFGSGDATVVSGLWIKAVEALSTTQMVIYPSAAITGAIIRFVG